MNAKLQVQKLRELGINDHFIATVMKDSIEVVHAWGAGITEPDSNTLITLDDLRQTVFVMTEGGFEPPEITNWIENKAKPNGISRARLLWIDPVSVLSQAHAEVLKRKIEAAEEPQT